MNRKELYKKIIKSQSGVLSITGHPGLAKSALMRQIAKEEKWNFIDIRLAQVDSSEVIGIPEKETLENGITVMKYAIPKYLYLANQSPTLICFDELNRATLEVRNAALKILLEREIEGYKLGKNVYMVALGNLGEEDKCEVEEFDMALNNRLIHLKHTIEQFPIKDWKKEFADENVNSYIINFVENNPSHYYSIPSKDDQKAFPSPRTWTFLSDFIGKDNKNIKEIIELCKIAGEGYVGLSIFPFIRFLEDQLIISINDIINKFDSIENKIKNINRARKSELLNELKAMNATKFTSKQIQNIKKFLDIIDADERVGYFKEILSKYDINKIKNLSNMFKKEYLDQLKDCLNVMEN